MSSGRRQTVSFYQLLMSGPKGDSPVEQVAWTDILAPWGKRSLKDQDIDGLIYHPNLDMSLPVLGVHRPTTSAFRSTIDMATQNIEDVLTKVDAEGRLVADSTAVTFLPDHNLLALSRGNQSSPGSGSLHTFLKTVMPLSRENHWVVRPILDPAKLSALQGGRRRAKKFEAVYKTRQDLFSASADENEPGLGRALANLAQAVGSELRVKIEITATGTTDRERSAGQSRLWDAVAESGESIAMHSDKADATVVDETGDSILNLVTRKFSIQTEIPDLGDNAKTFSALQEAVVRVAREEHDAVAILVDGGRHHGNAKGTSQ